MRFGEIMSTYVISDIHGDYQAFMNVLRQVNFSENDKLYILGDICDRGADFYKIFSYIKDKSNIEMILGNHDVKLMDFIKSFRDMPIRTYKFCLSCAKLDDLQNHYMIQESIKSVARECGENNVYHILKNEVLPFLQKLGMYKIVELNGVKYLLVHAGVNYDLPLDEQTLYDFTRTRLPFNHLDKPYYDYTIIHGHTETQTLPNSEGDGEVLFWKNNRKISIDGGASKGNGRLNLLRLDDMKVFYCQSKRTYEQDLTKNIEI
ncbi:MAG: fructose-bisphosphatase class III [Christensenellales bacterium]